MRLDDQIIHHLAVKGPMTVADLKAAIGCSRSGAQTAIRALALAKVVGQVELRSVPGQKKKSWAYSLTAKTAPKPLPELGGLIKRIEAMEDEVFRFRDTTVRVAQRVVHIEKRIAALETPVDPRYAEVEQDVRKRVEGLALAEEAIIDAINAEYERRVEAERAPS